MVRLSTFFPRAVRWQQPLTIVLVLSGVLTASSPATPDVPPPSCVDVNTGLTKQSINNGSEFIVHLGTSSNGHEVTICPPTPSQTNPVRRVRFKVRDSNVLLDCGGWVFDGAAGPEGAALPHALEFDKTAFPAIHDVVVRNCEFENYEKGIIVSGGDIEQGAGIGLANITLQDIALRDINGGAVKIGAHNRDNLLENVEITNASSYGVYLEAYSSRTTIRRCDFRDNGWSTDEAASDSVDGREAIAIDASSHNVITDSFFYNNKYAGIALYKNCGEPAEGSQTPVLRTEGANYNTIERNEFYYHDNATNGAAIVIASRQGMDPDTPGDAFVGTCGEPPVLGNRHRDIARHNVVRNNAFTNNVTSIRVRDSFNHIEGNTFMGDTWTDSNDDTQTRALYDVLVDADLVQAIGETIGVTVVDNVTLTKTADPSGKTFFPRSGANILFANNVDRSYKCVKDSLAPGNRCTTSTAPPLDRCLVTGTGAGTSTGCPARSTWVGFPNFPNYWLDTVYGSNILPDVCAARAQQLWEWCAVPGATFTIQTHAYVDGYPVAHGVYSGP